VERSGRFINMPLVVIVNAGSASSSEIMAGSLQDYQRATIVGEKTVGKGVEQQLINLDDGSQLRLVFRKWLTPMGNNINSDSPITPDIILEDYNAQTDKAFELLK
jgi:carboxyl-terminal processing protease